MSLKYYKNLDGLRGIAVLMVMVGHFIMGLHSSNYFLDFILSRISILGQLGVTLFFVLSGFLITRILVEAKNKNNYFKNFYTRRVLRIFPLYYFFLVIFFIVSPFIFHQPFSNFKDQISYYLYFQNFAITFKWNSYGPMHFWSLAVEEHFYLFWPLIIFLFNRKQAIIIAFSLIFMAIMLRYFFIRNDIEVFYFTFTRMDSLVIGSLLAFIEKGRFKVKIKYQYYLIFLSIPAFFMWTLWAGESDNTLQIFKYTFFSLIFFSLIGLVISLNDKNILNWFFRNPFLAFTGKISYGLYVYHLLGFEIINSFNQSKLWYSKFIGAFIVSYLLAICSYYLFESKFLKLKKYFKNKD